jgi:hypothetical protein
MVRFFCLAMLWQQAVFCEDNETITSDPDNRTVEKE